jgi:hypothetical protein
MTIFRILLLLSIIPFYTHAESLTDRQKIINAMGYFHQWDFTGSKELAEKSVEKSVRYNRVSKEGKHISYTPDFEWKGKGVDAYLPIIIGLDIYGGMAVVRVVHHHEEKGRYLKAIIFHKLAEGWRITNVSWGKITPEK